MWILFVILVTIVLGILDGGPWTGRPLERRGPGAVPGGFNYGAGVSGGILANLFALATLVPGLAVSVRRSPRHRPQRLVAAAAGGSLCDRLRDHAWRPDGRGTGSRGRGWAGASGRRDLRDRAARLVLQRGHHRLEPPLAPIPRAFRPNSSPRRSNKRIKICAPPGSRPGGVSPTGRQGARRGRCSYQGLAGKPGCPAPSLHASILEREDDHAYALSHPRCGPDRGGHAGHRAHSATTRQARRRSPKAIAGRVAGKPVSCINQPTVGSSQVIDGTAIVYEVGSTLCVNRPAHRGGVTGRRRHPGQRDDRDRSSAAWTRSGRLDNASRIEQGFA